MKHVIEQAEDSDNPVWVRGRWGARYYPASVSPAELQARARATRPVAAPPQPKAAPPQPTAASQQLAPAPRTLQRFSIDADTVRVHIPLDRSWDVGPARPRVASTKPAATPVQPHPVAAPPARSSRAFASGELKSRARLRAESHPVTTPDAAGAEPFPTWLDSRDLQVRLTHDLDRTTRHYEQRVRTQPQCGAGWVGLAVVALSRGQVKQAANLLVRCHELEPDFPCGRLVRDSFEGRPELWYDLARALVETRRRGGYACADLILEQCVRCERTSDALRRRAMRVRGDLVIALDARDARDRRTARGPGRPSLAAAGLALVAVMTAIVCLGLLGV